jgi:uncharacterized protein YjbI with pentapeptide repeats
VSNDTPIDELKAFWNDVREQVSQGKTDFKGRRFPEVYINPKDPTEHPLTRGFNGLVFTSHVNFEDAVFEGSAYFIQTKFEKSVSFSNAIFNGPAHFTKAVFKDVVLFNGTIKFKMLCHFVEAVFHSNTLFTNASISNGIFYDSKFLGVAEFGEAQFGSAYFNRVVFEHYARFVGAQFKEEADFSSATFMRSATFGDCRFYGRAKFSGARALELVEFPIPVCDKDKRAFLNPAQGETAYRFAKQSAMNIGNPIAASDYHYAERCAAEVGKRSSWNETDLPKLVRAQRVIGGWLEFIVMRMLFGYGAKPLRIILASISVILIFTFCYLNSPTVCINEVKKVCEPSFINSLFISTSTFTTLGYYGGFEITGYTRFFLGVEAFLGALFMSAFLVVLGRRYM